MNTQFFTFSNESNKLKSKLLVLSCISLFIGLSQALPENVAILGLNLSQNKEVTGWFIFIITLYFLFKFSLTSILEIIHYSLPSLIKRATKNTTGDTIGLSSDECYADTQPHNQSDDSEFGTARGELKEINDKNIKIQNSYKNEYIKLSNITVYSVDFLFPIIFWGFGAYYLFTFLCSIK